MLHEHASIVRMVHGWFAMMIAVCGIGSSALAWERPHSDGNNSGFADVKTIPAKTAPVTVPNLGTFAPGAGPVVAPDGTVYLGSLEGKLIALHADGSPYWSREIGHGESIVASPAIGSDGMVYVIGVKRYTDNRVQPAVEVVESTLNRFTASGGYLGATPFPKHGVPGAAIGGPNIWKSGNNEAVIIAATYPHGAGSAGHDIYLIAFSTAGGVLAETKAQVFVPTVSGGWGVGTWRTMTCLIPIIGLPACVPHGFTAPGQPIDSPPSNVGIFTYAGGGTPWVILSDHMQDLIGYTFTGDAFYENFRIHTKDYLLRSGPMVLPDGHTLIGVEKLKRAADGVEEPSYTGGIVFGGPNMTKAGPIDGRQMVYATPTRMADGRVALVGVYGQLTILQGDQVAAEIDMPGGSIVSAAASRSHLFVSTSDAFLSYDTNTLAEVGRIDWVGGGVSPPAIGPKGHVYALASNILFVFPAPFQTQVDTATLQPQGQLIETDPGQQTTQPSSHLYTPPLTTNGNRLFACEELDQDNCGQGDYHTISLAFCQKQGFTQVNGIDVDSRKVKAETLDGHFCKKKKCKVFDTINCTN